MPQNWSKITKVLSFKDKIIVSFILIVIFASLLFWIRYIYLQTTISVPKIGGQYTEGIVGQPIYINPLLSQTSEADADLSQLVYSGLLKYDREGNLINDLTQSFEISEDKKSYIFHLKQNVFWHDKEKLNADDVKFTIDILQDPAYKSPLRQSWQGVEVEKIDDYTVKFSLEQPYFGFLNKLTLGILPKHIWENISSEKFTLADYNLRPIGSGPYSLSSVQKDSSGTIASVELLSFPEYYADKPFVPDLTFNFYPDDISAVEAYNQKEVSGLGNLPLEKLTEIKSEKSTVNHKLAIPRFFSLFLNQTKSIAIADDNVRQALALSVNRDEIVQIVLHGKGVAISSPFLPQMKEFNSDSQKNTFDVEKAREILENSGWKMNEEKGFRQKGENELKFKILTIDWPELSQIASLLKEQWQKVGIQVEVEILTISDMQQNHIRPREYEALLYGQEGSFDVDLYSFWHSSQKQDPGLNLSLFDNKKADSLLEEARQETDSAKRIEKYAEFQNVLAEKMPAIFLFSPYYIYPVSDQIKGIEMNKVNSPSWRFAEVEKWFINTRRVKK